MAKQNLGDIMMSQSPAGVMGKATKSTSPKSSLAPGAVERITIEVADNGGYSVTCSRKADPSSKSGYQEPKKHVFSTKQELDDYLDEALGTAGDSDSDGGDGTTSEGEDAGY